MAQSINLEISFSAANEIVVTRVTNELSQVVSRLAALRAEASQSSTAMRMFQGETNRLAQATQGSLNQGVTLLTSAFSGMFAMLARLSRLGFGIFVGEAFTAIAALKSLGRAFLDINEQFGNLQITLKSSFQSLDIAERLKNEIVKITATSPLKLEEILDVTRSLSVIPYSRGEIAKQSASEGGLDEKGFLQRGIGLIEKMVAFRPDKTEADAMFALREAMAGEFRSLLRRFGVPTPSVVAASGQTMDQIKNDPKAAFKAIEAFFNGIITPEAIQELMDQPTRLFRNIIERMFRIPLLEIGNAGFYRQFIGFFSELYASLVRFTTTGIQPFAQRISDSLGKIFNSIIAAGSGALEKLLHMAGAGEADMPGVSVIERVYSVITKSLEGFVSKLPGLIDGAEKFLAAVLPAMQAIANLALKLISLFSDVASFSPVIAALGASFVMRDLPAIAGNVMRGGTARIASGFAGGVAETVGNAGFDVIGSGPFAASANRRTTTAAASGSDPILDSLGLTGSTQFSGLKAQEANQAARAAENDTAALLAQPRWEKLNNEAMRWMRQDASGDMRILPGSPDYIQDLLLPSGASAAATKKGGQLVPWDTYQRTLDSSVGAIPAYSSAIKRPNSIDPITGRLLNQTGLIEEGFGSAGNLPTGMAANLAARGTSTLAPKIPTMFETVAGGISGAAKSAYAGVVESPITPFVAATAIFAEAVKLWDTRNAFYTDKLNAALASAGVGRNLPITADQSNQLVAQLKFNFAEINKARAETPGVNPQFSIEAASTETKEVPQKPLPHQTGFLEAAVQGAKYTYNSEVPKWMRVDPNAPLFQPHAGLGTFSAKMEEAQPDIKEDTLSRQKFFTQESFQQNTESLSNDYQSLIDLSKESTDKNAEYKTSTGITVQKSQVELLKNEIDVIGTVLKSRLQDSDAIIKQGTEGVKGNFSFAPQLTDEDYHKLKSFQGNSNVEGTPSYFLDRNSRKKSLPQYEHIAEQGEQVLVDSTSTDVTNQNEQYTEKLNKTINPGADFAKRFKGMQQSMSLATQVMSELKSFSENTEETSTVANQIDTLVNKFRTENKDNIPLLKAAEETLSNLTSTASDMRSGVLGAQEITVETFNVQQKIDDLKNSASLQMSQLVDEFETSFRGQNKFTAAPMMSSLKEALTRFTEAMNMPAEQAKRAIDDYTTLLTGSLTNPKLFGFDEQVDKLRALASEAMAQAKPLELSTQELSKTVYESPIGQMMKPALPFSTIPELASAPKSPSVSTPASESLFRSSLNQGNWPTALTGFEKPLISVPDLSLSIERPTTSSPQPVSASDNHSSVYESIAKFVDQQSVTPVGPLSSLPLMADKALRSSITLPAAPASSIAASLTTGINNTSSPEPGTSATGNQGFFERLIPHYLIDAFKSPSAGNTSNVRSNTVFNNTTSNTETSNALATLQDRIFSLASITASLPAIATASNSISSAVFNASTAAPSTSNVSSLSQSVFAPLTQPRPISAPLTADTANLNNAFSLSVGTQNTDNSAISSFVDRSIPQNFSSQFSSSLSSINAPYSPFMMNLSPPADQGKLDVLKRNRDQSLVQNSDTLSKKSQQKLGEFNTATAINTRQFNEYNRSRANQDITSVFSEAPSLGSNFGQSDLTKERIDDLTASFKELKVNLPVEQMKNLQVLYEDSTDPRNIQGLLDKYQVLIPILDTVNDQLKAQLAIELAKPSVDSLQPSDFFKPLALGESGPLQPLSDEEIKSKVMDVSRISQLRGQIQSNQQTSTSFQRKHYEVTGDNNAFSSFGTGVLNVTEPWNAGMQNMSQQGEQMARSLSSNLSTAFDGFIDGSKKGSQAFQQFAANIFKSATSIMVNKEIESLLGVLFHGFSSSASSSSTSSSVENSTLSSGGSLVGTLATQTFATGGVIRGGTGLQDDVPIMAMGGEGILNQRAMSVLGERGLNALNEGRVSRFANGGVVPGGYPTPMIVRGYAEGGMVDSDVTSNYVSPTSNNDHSSNSTNHIAVTVNHNGSAGVQSNTQSTSAGDRQRQAAEMARNIKAAVLQTIDDQSRAGGRFYRKL